MPEYIEREKAIYAINKMKSPARSPAQNELIRAAQVGINSIRAADVAPVRHGRWLPTTKWWQGGSAWKQCSECGILHLGKSNFCPNCGCRMDGGIE